VKDEGVGAATGGTAGGCFANGLFEGNIDFCSPPNDLRPANGLDSEALTPAKGFTGVVVVVVVVVAGVVVVVVVIFANGFEDTDEPKEKAEVGRDGAGVLIELNNPPPAGADGLGALIPPFMPF
jgi:hypothetical protein